MPVFRRFVESVAEGFHNTMALFMQLVKSIGGDLYRKITAFWQLVKSTGGDLYNSITVFRQSVEAIAKDLDKMVVFRGREFVQSIGQGLAFIIASILLNLISNRIWDADQNKDVEHVSGLMIFLHYIPVSFIHYLPLTIMTLMLWGVGNHFFIKFQDPGRLPIRVAGLPNPQGTGPLNPQGRGPLNPQGTGPLNPQGTGPSNPQGRGPLDPQGTGPSNPQGTRPSATQGTGPPDLGILDNDLRLFFYHLKQHYSLPAPAMLPTSAIQSIAWAEASPGNMALTIHIKGVVTDVELVYKPVVTLPSGSKVLYRRFKIGPETGMFELEALRKLVLESMNQARILDPDCALQFGSFAVLKYIDSGLKWWRLQEHWTPSIHDISQSPRNLLDSLCGYCRKWIIRGRNLQTATLKASTVDEIENLKILYHHKMGTGEDELLCEEPQLVQHAAPMFRKKIYICASNSVEVEDGVVFDLQSEPINFNRAYWIFVIKSLIPSPWAMTMIFSLSLLGGLSHITRGKHDDLFPKLAWGYFDLHHEDHMIVGTNLEANSVLSHTLNELYKFFLVYMFVIFLPVCVSTLWQFLCDQVSQLGSDIPGLRRTTTLDDTTRILSPTFPLLCDNNLLEDTLSLATPPIESNQLENISTSSPTLTTPTPIDTTTHPEEAEDNPGPSKEGPDGQDLSTSHALDGYPPLSVQGLVGPVKDPKDPKDQLESQGPNETNDHRNRYLDPLINPFLNQELDTMEKEGSHGKYKYGVYGSDSPDLLHSILGSDFQKESGKESSSRDGAASYDQPDAGAPGNNFSSSGLFPGWVDFEAKDQESATVSYVLPPPPPPPLPPLPPKWKEAIDFETGHRYYYSPETNESSWERPKAGIVIADQNKKPENSSTGPRESPPYTVVPEFQKPARYESIEKGKNIVEHGDNARRPQITPRSEDFDTPAGNPTVDLNEETRKFERGYSSTSDHETRLENDNRSESKKTWWEPFGAPFFKLGRRAFQKQSPIFQLEGLPVKFSYKQLSAATGGFSSGSLAGCGGFGDVYRGVLPSGIAVAVKTLRTDVRRAADDFMTEVSILCQLRHRNVIELLGWCDDDAAKRQKKVCLVFEWMPNGSLDALLFGPSEGKAPSWPQRLKILTGIAAGLDYLHNGWKQQVVHREVKCSNILLDEEYNAKLGDFALAHVGAHDIEPDESGIFGTIAYLSPEYAMTGKFTSKSDVFAFGVVVLEVVCGRTALDRNLQQDERFIADWVWQRLKEGDLTRAVDARLKDYDTHLVERVLKIGLQCSLVNPEARPSMRQIVQMLAGEVPVPSLPPSRHTDDSSKV